MCVHPRCILAYSPTNVSTLTKHRFGHASAFQSSTFVSRLLHYCKAIQSAAVMVCVSVEDHTSTMIIMMLHAAAAAVGHMFWVRCGALIHPSYWRAIRTFQGHPLPPLTFASFSRNSIFSNSKTR